MNEETKVEIKLADLFELCTNANLEAYYEAKSDEYKARLAEVEKELASLKGGQNLTATVGKGGAK